MATEQVELNIEPYPRQQELIETDATEVLFGGASEGGKSYGIRLALIFWCAAIPGLQCVIIRKYYNDVIKNHMEGEGNFRAMLKPWIDKGWVKITESTIKFVFHKEHSQITLVQCRTDEDFEKAQGLTKHVLVWDEATQVRAQYINDIRGWVRMSKDMQDRLPEHFKGKFPRIIYTCNPIGESVSWFRRNFIEVRRPYEKEKVGAFIRQFIPSKVTDNLSADAEAQRDRLSTMHSQQVVEALINGNWDHPTGDYFKEYDDELMSVDDFMPPDHWFKYRTFDWGGNDPFAVYWVCVSDGFEFFDRRDNKRWFPRGAIIAYREWYGCQKDNPEKGLAMRNEDIADGIRERTTESTSGLTFTDRFVFADRGGSKDKKKWNMADDFSDRGVPLTLGNTARIFGYNQMRNRMKGVNGVPMSYICKSCVYLRRYIPILGYSDNDAEDAQAEGEATHSTDAWRLAHTVRPIIKDSPKKESRIEIRKKLYTPQTILKSLNRRPLGKYINRY